MSNASPAPLRHAVRPRGAGSLLRPSLVPLAGLAAAAIALAATPAHAQWGKIKDLGKSAVEGAAKKAAGDATAAPLKPGEVRFDGNLVEITDARLAALMRGLDAEVAARPEAERRYHARAAAHEEGERTIAAREAAFEREHGAWVKRRDERERCIEAANRRLDPAIEREQKVGESIGRRADAEMSDAKEKRLEALQERMIAAQARGDQVAMRALADTVQREIAGFVALGGEAAASGQRTAAASAALSEEMRKCGPEVPEPKAPERASWANADEALREVGAAGAAAAGLTQTQYDLLRERVEAYVRLNGRGRTSYVFAAGELEALARHADALRAKIPEGAAWTPRPPKGRKS